MGCMLGMRADMFSAAIFHRRQLPSSFPACASIASCRADFLLLPSLKAASLPPSPALSTVPSLSKPCLPFDLPLTLQLSPLPLEHLRHDLLCTVAVFVGSFAWIRFFDLLVQKNLLDQKLSRKLVHISTGILYALMWPLFSSSPWARYFALAIPLANALKLLVYGLGILKNETVVKTISRSGSPRELLGGPLYYVLILSACTAFFWRDSPVGMVALAIMCGGDGIADILGRRLGSVKLPYNTRKSWAGSISMFVFGFILSTSFLYYYSSLGFYHVVWARALRIVAWISLAATVVESLPVSMRLDDNVSVPLVSVVLGSVLFPGAVL